MSAYNGCRVRPRNSLLTLAGSDYLFSEKKVRAENILSLGIGDWTLPLPSVAARAMEEAAHAFAIEGGFHGYPPTEGEPSLREALAGEYRRCGVPADASEIFLSDGAKTDLAVLPTLLENPPLLLPIPCYPAVSDGALLRGQRVLLLPATAQNGFLPMPDDLSSEARAALGTEGALLYLCSPGNPSGSFYTKEKLREWVTFCLHYGVLLLYDSAYVGFLPEYDEHGEPIPRSIYNIPGADGCAIEIGSFSKFAGFTGLRCGFLRIPRELTLNGHPFLPLYRRRQATCFNGVSHLTQCGAKAILTAEGKGQCRAALTLYKENAAALAALLSNAGLSFSGGVGSPYLYLQLPFAAGSAKDFSLRAERCGLIVTPGDGFGKAAGETRHYCRLSAFFHPRDRKEVLRRLQTLLG